MVTMLIENWIPDLENMACVTNNITVVWDIKMNLNFMTNGNI